MKDWNSVSVDRYYDTLNLGNEVAIGILDISRDIPDKFVQKRCFDMTYFYINRMAKMGYCKYVGFNNNVKTILEKAIKQDKKYCMIAAQGLLLTRGASLLDQSLSYAKNNPNFFVVGHIMDKKKQHYLTEGAYPGLHRQYLFVNLDKWTELGKPEFDEIGVYKDRKPKLQNFKFSEETVHADYTPAWVDFAEEKQEWEVTSDGSNWIDIALRHGIRIDNLTSDMRACKIFLYPYNKTNILAKSWIQKDYWEVDKLNQSQKAWLRKLDYQEKIEKDRVYAFNTETLSSEGIRTTQPIEHLFTAAAGFKPLAILNANRFHDRTMEHPGTKVHYFDWCDASLLYKRDLIETWDGYDLHLWLLEHDLKYNFSSTYRGNYESFWLQEVEEHGGREAFKKLWDRYVELDHAYYKIDIVNNPEELFHIMNAHHGNKVLWTTNIWSSEMLHWNLEPEVLENKFKKFRELVPNDLILYGHDYVAMDLRESIRNTNGTTHPRFQTVH